MNTVLETDSEGNGSIQMRDNNISVGKLSFTVVELNVIKVTHTFVNEDYRGQGIASKLVDALIEYCTAKGLTIIPVCSYVVKLAQRDERLKKLVNQD